MTHETVLVLRGLSKRYGTKVALSRIEFHVKAGEVVGLIGPNGAGKTTLIECAIGITRPTAGSASIMGFDTWTQHGLAARHYGVQFQTTQLAPFTRVSDTFWFYQRAFMAIDNPRLLCTEFGLSETHYRSYFRTLSGGEKRRVLIALAFLGNPMIVLLDEPTAGMDPSVRSQFWDAVRRRRDAGHSIVCSSHDLEDMDLNCDRVAFLVDGSVRASGSVVDIVRQYDAFMTYVIDADDPKLLLDRLSTQMPGVDDMVWYGYVQGRILVITARPFADSTLERVLGPVEIRHRFSRRSNLQDIYHVCTETSRTPS